MSSQGRVLRSSGRVDVDIPVPVPQKRKARRSSKNDINSEPVATAPLTPPASSSPRAQTTIDLTSSPTPSPSSSPTARRLHGQPSFASSSSLSSFPSSPVASASASDTVVHSTDSSASSQSSSSSHNKNVHNQTQTQIHRYSESKSLRTDVLDPIRTALQKLEDINTSREEMERRVERLETELEEERQKHAATTSQKDTQFRASVLRISELAAAVTTALKERDAARAQAADLQHRHNTLSASLDTLAAKVASLETERTMHADAMLQNDILERQASKAFKDLDEMRFRFEATKRELEVVKERERLLDPKAYLTLKMQAEEARRELEDVKREVERTRREKEERERIEMEVKKLREMEAQERARKEREEQERLEQEREEARRQEEVLAARVRMQEMQKVEAERKRKREMDEEEARVLQEAEAERRRQHAMMLEEERKKAAAKREATRQRKWQAATVTEQKRCIQRDHDLGMYKHYDQWPHWHDFCIRRFQTVLDEFIIASFSEARPMTELSVPWPLLSFGQPSFKLNTVTWASTEKFFKTVEELFPAQYSKVLSAAQRAFHPDRWRSRKVLESVRDEKVRAAMGKAGNEVSQAINALVTEER